MDVWVLPNEIRLQVAEDSVGLQIEFPSSKLVLLEEKPLPPIPLCLERLLEVHLDADCRGLSDILPRIDVFSDGDLLKTLGLRLSMPMTDKPPGVASWFDSAPNKGSRSSRMEA